MVTFPVSFPSSTIGSQRVEPVIPCLRAPVLVAGFLAAAGFAVEEAVADRLDVADEGIFPVEGVGLAVDAVAAVAVVAPTVAGLGFSAAGGSF